MVLFTTYSNLLTALSKDLKGLGYKRVCLRSDGENPITKVLSDLSQWFPGEVIEEVTAEGDSQSNGNAEGGINIMKGHVRTIKLDLEMKLKTIIPEDHNLMTWLVKYASQSYNRFHMGQDGRSPNERVLGRKILGPIMDDLPRWPPGTILGISWDI